MDSEEKTEIKTDVKEVNDSIVDVQLSKILEWALYIIGAVCIGIGMYFYSNDLDYGNSPFNFYEEQYVGGDAYNYIISASRSSAIMVKSLIWIVLGCTSIIVARTFNNKLCK